MITTTNFPLVLADSFGDPGKTCFGPCAEGVDIWPAWEFAQERAAATGENALTIQQQMMAASLDGLTLRSYLRQARGHVADHVFDPAGWVRAQMPVLIAQLYAMFTANSVARGAISRVRDLARRIRALHKAETLNFAALMIRALKADPAWQARVRRDLGGEAALIRWETTSDNPHAPQPKPELGRKENSRATRPRAAIRMDRDGLFRLAPLTRARAKNTRPPYKRSAAPRSAAMVLKQPNAIALTPDDLRGPAKAEGHNTVMAITRAALRKTWNRIYTEHWHWNTAIMWADLALTIPAFRADIAPP